MKKIGKLGRKIVAVYTDNFEIAKMNLVAKNDNFEIAKMNLAAIINCM
jgi:hypothetical protein